MSLAAMLLHVVTTQAIAAFNGASRELAIVQERARNLWRHINTVVHTQWWYGIVEDVSLNSCLPVVIATQFVVKYCASTVAMVVILGKRTSIYPCRLAPPPKHHASTPRPFPATDSYLATVCRAPPRLSDHQARFSVAACAVTAAARAMRKRWAACAT